jgi:hypothetical protein
VPCTPAAIDRGFTTIDRWLTQPQSDGGGGRAAWGREGLTGERGHLPEGIGQQSAEATCMHRYICGDS